LISILAFDVDSEFLVVAKVWDKLFGTVGERLASLGRIDAMKPDALASSLVHDGNRIAVRNTDDLACEVFANDGGYGWSIKGVSIVSPGFDQSIKAALQVRWITWQRSKVSPHRHYDY
jgi:hypothetical protein